MHMPLCILTKPRQCISAHLERNGPRVGRQAVQLVGSLVFDDSRFDVPGMMVRNWNPVQTALSQDIEISTN